jgi:cytochrome c-type biogenesis protein CcmH/NrfG
MATLPSGRLDSPATATRLQLVTAPSGSGDGASSAEAPEALQQALREHKATVRSQSILAAL